MSNIYEIDNDKVVGFENEAAKIINQLVNGSKEREVVLITGMGGLGKTTLVKRVYEEKSVVNHFDKHAWCTISQEYDFEDLLNKVYNQVCGKETKTGSIVEKLRKSLMGWRYLIVLDDIWSLKAWEEFNRVFPSCGNGSRVVLTSRQESVVFDAKPICLPFFTVDESWELLQVKLFKGKECPKELENIGKQISKECGGLPLIVGLVAGLLEGVEKSPQMWQEFLNTLSSQVAFRSRMLSNDVIELSYKHLSHHLKQCLLYFSAFKEDVEIEVSYLIELWISEGFIEIMAVERVEDTAKHYLNHLVGSNLIMVSVRNYDGGILCCVVHDLVHDFCLAKAKEENFLHIIKMKDEVDPILKFTPHRISFHRLGRNKILNELVSWNSPISTILGYPKIHTTRSGVYNGSWVAKKFEHLTILNFEFITVDKSILSEMNSLIHLKYLALYLVGRGSVSPLSLKNLQHLITLKLTSESELHLPKYFLNMKSLRHMTICHYDCHSCPTEPTPAGGIETISGLEVLQSLDLETFLCIRTDGHLLRKLSHLKYLNCAVSPYPFADEIDMLHHLEFLQLHDPRFPKYHENPHLLKIRKFPPNIKEINLESIYLSLSTMSIISQLSNLEALILVACKFEEEEWNVEEEILFCKLKYLELNNPSIRIWNISSAAESFPCLEQVILNGCWKLQTVPYSLADILTLKLISVRGCTDTCERSVKEIEEDVQGMGKDEHLKIILTRGIMISTDSDVSLANMTGPMKRRHDRNRHWRRDLLKRLDEKEYLRSL
ncbi:putative late blight resistance protein homolog R1A-4 isoform X2 [Ipomoea triloba]|uniref:putative late blight resistance protein homolog R1A-4 isoform X2 n=1 Tax=Ipomoea triloba TaxID=35885 RepID=UPI00125DCBBA|nr:putative late blight resistance protein homolog R1A-4 isoform X2 [Ipomoea triloba]